MSRNHSFVIAIDGPAASGKGTLGRRLAASQGFAHLDTGLTYRAVAHALMQAGLPLDREELAVVAAEHIDLAALGRNVLSAHDIGEAASRIAVMPGLRRTLVARQRDFAENPPGGAPGAVLDGRDIGTVVCPHAAVKLYVTASPQARAARRHAEILAGGGSADFAEILADIERRDARDTGRADSPLRPAADAHLIDTTGMDIETAFGTALAIVKAAQPA